MINLKTPLIGTKIERPLTTYYDKITRTSDLLLGSGKLAVPGRTLVPPSYYIAPATTSFDDMVKEALYELNTALSKKMVLPDANTIVSSSIKNLLENSENTSNSTKETFQSFLQKSGYSGPLIKVASEINTSRVDAFIRTALSNLGIFFFLAYRTIEGNGIKDTSGIATNIMESIGLVQSYVNTKLISKVIKNENLNVTQTEVTKMENYFKNREIDYTPGKPTQIIEAFFVSLKEGGSLFGLVRDFVNSDKVKLPRDINKDELIKKMVDYLVNIGYVYDENISQDDNLLKSGLLPDAGNTFDNTMVDDFDGAIEGVGAAIQKRFVKAGIKRFAHLASLDNNKLKTLLNDKGITDYTDIIKQAKFIADSKFEELIAFQKNLNKK